MASRIRKRLELAKEVELADQRSTAEPAAAVKKRAKAKTPGAVRTRKPRQPKPVPRVRARWGVFDGTMKQVAIFDYNQRTAAEEKLADLLATKKGGHFLQIVKDLMPELPAEVAAVQ